jgi:glutaredoxin
MLVKALREGLGCIIVFLDFVTRPRPMSRPPAQQRAVESAARDLALYQFYACPFCVKTRRALHRLNVPVELRDAQNDAQHRQALQAGGGRVQVPCLRIDGADGVVWMYESSAIIAYLDRTFGPERGETTTEAAEQVN